MGEIIDTHIHIWDFDKAHYQWLENDTSILKNNYAIEDLEAERAKTGISGGVLVQAANNFEDTDWMLETAQHTDWILGVVGWLPLKDPELTGKMLEENFLSNPFFKGVRHLIHDEPDPEWLLQPEVIESLKILSGYAIPYDLVGIKPDHIKTALKVSQKVPELKMVFDHLNQPPIQTGEYFGEWGELMKEAARHPNFYAKISGLGTSSGKPQLWGREDVSPSIEFALENFGINRCFSGGDWPVSLLAGTYEYSWSVYKRVLLELLDEAGQDKVLRLNAIEFYNLNHKK